VIRLPHLPTLDGKRTPFSSLPGIRAGLGDYYECRRQFLSYVAQHFSASAPAPLIPGTLPSLGSLSRLCGSGIINNRKFVERHPPWQLPDDRLVTEFPDELEGNGIGAFLAFRECLGPEQRDFMGQSMSGVSDRINSTGRNHHPRLELPPQHCGRFYQNYRLTITPKDPGPLSS
jgi:hypothetical protein